MVAKKDPAAVALGRKGGKKGGPARAAKLTSSQRSESARKAVQSRWAKAKGVTYTKSATMNSKTTRDEVSNHASKKALHDCLKRIKAAKSEEELRRLTEELQRIVFHRQYTNAEN